MNEELDALTDKLLEVSMKLRAAEGELKEIRGQHEKELSKFSHNLKNPIGVIASFTEMLKANTVIDEEKRSKYLEIIQSSSNYSLALVNSFQEFNQLKNKSVAFEITSENVVTIVNEAISDSATTFSSRNQAVIFDGGLSEVSLMDLDKSAFKKVILSLLDNASRFSPEETTIRIAVSENDAAVIITITDTGIGISEKDLPQLTTTFFTVNTYDEFKNKCIGLGLTTSEIILKEFGGTLSISSESGRGTQTEIMLKKA